MNTSCPQEETFESSQLHDQAFFFKPQCILCFLISQGSVLFTNSERSGVVGKLFSLRDTNPKSILKL